MQDRQRWSTEARAHTRVEEVAVVQIQSRSQRPSVTQAVAAARSGTLTVLVVEGGAGVGKSTFLDGLIADAKGFTVRIAEAVHATAMPYSLLAQWGVEVAATPLGGPVQPFVAAQRLRALTDALTATGPALLVLDDAHWADAESLEAVSWLVRRSRGDRLLVAVSQRPLAPDQQSGWRRWVARSASVTQLALTGVDREGAIALAHERLPDLPVEVALQLWEHTGANPLYLSALLTEHSADELSTMRTLPAPAEYAHDVATRLAELSDRARNFAHAAAVLGSGRLAVPDVAAVCEHDDDPWPAMSQLAAAGLLEIVEGDGTTFLRWVHALTQAAVYQSIGPSLRRRLHARAAGVVAQQTSAFEHRLAAAAQYDEVLAGDLQTHAEGLHAQRSYRVAATFLQWASIVTADRDRRQARWLDAQFEAILARDFTSVEADLDDVRESMDVPRRTLVLGALACLQGRFREGVAELAVVANWEPAVGDPMTRARLEALLAWGRTLLGHDVSLIESGLARAGELGADDPALTAQRLLAQAHVGGRRGTFGAFLTQLQRLPAVASATPVEATGLLIWRGTDRLNRGAINGAISDLRELQHRQHDGIVDFLSNGFDAMLGLAYWFQGRWDLAQVVMRQARDVPPELVGLLTHATAPLAACAAGDYPRAAAELDAAAAVFDERPWHEAVEIHVILRVITLHAAGSPAQRAAALPDARRRWPTTAFGEGLNDGLWQIHLALAHLWAGEPVNVLARLERVQAWTLQDTSLTACTRWLRGLLAESTDDHEEALSHLRAAAELDCTQLPLYRAHILTDRARLASRTGHDVEADASRTEAEQAYRDLGADTYLAQFSVQTAAPSRDTEPAFVLSLTEREHDVLTLVVDGYSYKQISQELFITQSTVSYHLSNIYPKAGVSSRHELTRWVHDHPNHIKIAAIGVGASG